MPTDGEGSFVDADGRLRHFSRAAFVSLSKDLSRCFICGSSSTDFNGEHIVPDWLLSRYGMHSRRITLPNGHECMYGRYKLRCCVACNSLMGDKIERPVSELLSGTVQEMKERLPYCEPSLLYQWLCLLFIKCHLKDREFRIDPDMRGAPGQIGFLYDWDGLHHIHAVARAAHSDADIDHSVIGTILVFPTQDSYEPFDFLSFSGYSTIAVRLGCIGVAGVLNDAGAVGYMVAKYFSDITGPLSPIQFREVAARMAYGNVLLCRRPTFRSELQGENLTIRSLPRSPWPISPIDERELGEVVAGACAPLLRQSSTPNPECIIEGLRQRKLQFLYRDDGSFIDD